MGLMAKQAINNSDAIGGTDLSRWETEVGRESLYCTRMYTHTHKHMYTIIYDF